MIQATLTSVKAKRLYITVCLATQSEEDCTSSSCMSVFKEKNELFHARIKCLMYSAKKPGFKWLPIILLVTFSFLNNTMNIDLNYLSVSEV
jgi:hypothetical protein